MTEQYRAGYFSLFPQRAMAPAFAAFRSGAALSTPALRTFPVDPELTND